MWGRKAASGRGPFSTDSAASRLSAWLAKPVSWSYHDSVRINGSVEAGMKKSYAKPTLTKRAVLSMVVAGGTPPDNGGGEA
jgi:hypothetical protein